MNFFPVTPGGNYFQKTQTLFSDFQCVETEKSFGGMVPALFHLHYFVFNGCFWEARCACLDICPVTGSFISHPASPFPLTFLH